MTTPWEAYVGIDVGKTWLDVARWGSEEVWRVANDDEGVAKILACVATWEPRLIAVEATGGYERRAATALRQAGWKVATRTGDNVRCRNNVVGRVIEPDSEGTSPIETLVTHGY